MTSTTKVAAALTLVALTLAGNPRAWAQEAPSREDRAEAQRRFRVGIEHYEAERYRAAIEEFRAANEAAPNPTILYNLGRAWEGLDHAVNAVSHLERYLVESGDRIRARRRAEVEALLETLRQRIGLIHVTTNVEASVVMIDWPDDEAGLTDVATTPLAQPIRVNAGTLVVAARATGHDTARREVNIAGGEEITVDLELRPLLERVGTIRVDSGAVEGVEVRLDGRFVGVTPMNETLPTPPGSHVLEGARTGYVTSRVELEVEDAREVRGELEMRVDEDAPSNHFGAVVLVTPDVERRVFVDGALVEPEGDRLRLPVGAHRIRLEVAEREVVVETVDVGAEGSMELAPRFRWTPDARAERVAGRETQRTVGWVFLGAAAVALGVSIAVRLDAEATFDDHAAQGEMVELCRETRPQPVICSMDGGLMWNQTREAADYNQAADNVNIARIGTGIGFGAAAASAVAGLLLLITAGGGDIDEAAQEARGPSLHLGLGGGALSGRF